MKSQSSILSGVPLAALILCAPALAQQQPAAASTGPVRVLVNPGDSGEVSRVALYGAWKGALEQALRKEDIKHANVALSADATADLAATRSRIHDIFVAPAHVIGSAVRYGYVPVLGLSKPVQAVLVAPKDSGINNLQQAAGKRLGLPLQDSVVTYLLRGEVNASNTTIKRHFGPLYDTRYQDALLPCLQIRRCDVVAVEKAVFDRWVAAGEQVKIVMESKPVPGLSVAVRDNARVSADQLNAALTETLHSTGLLRTENAKAISHAAADFKYVSTLGYFTPRALPGANVVDAKAVVQLLQAGAIYVDTRTDTEFKAGHVSGAKLVPYGEKSAKEADFDAALDQFDLAKLGANRDAELIFACNGPECWKSFKASQAALKAGYRRVHWFRGGFPEWRTSGMKFDMAAQQ
ncbi:PhnD/SsuA/transferrin family substrate-binding protein [Caenimonas sedimenti]|uniref:PhnD/SsuA/transferrin family substrate-binding protein n=1 Tax=Caenimonas sedimenti TaxID=2596921 RepID=A0A562ZT40_9BURK|nr:rhodanese-like domain-containing protein [Caenimonas sedimenti]TWO71772.1 PhnD/SsuA/transferrin family substrate-binding protein [Caenimonas sedimenti]